RGGASDGGDYGFGGWVLNVLALLRLGGDLIHPGSQQPQSCGAGTSGVLLGLDDRQGTDRELQRPVHSDLCQVMGDSGVFETSPERLTVPVDVQFGVVKMFGRGIPQLLDPPG